MVFFLVTFSKNHRFNSTFCRVRKLNRHVPNLRTNKRFLLLPVSELNIAMNTLTQLSQKMFFPQDCKMLALGKPVMKNSPLLSLRPFLDPVGCIRVRGRIQRSFLSYEEKHPLVLSKFTHISRLLINNAHILTLHGGTQLTHSQLFTKF